MKRQTVNQTLKRLVVDLASHPFLLFLAFLGTIAQVGLSIYLPILIGGDFTLYCQEILSSLPEANRDEGNSDSVD
ncbi:ABC transporter ATP-binding protein/permease [Streptococcus pneumoniae]|nr:ABC transporter ATP-binding protein/permease [Streptococcus pneumoniae]